VLGAKNNSSQ